MTSTSCVSACWVCGTALDKTSLDEAIDQWRAQLTACVRAKGGHFEQIDLNWMLVLWLDILSQFWIEWPCWISTQLTFQVSQGIAATDLRWGENFNKFLFRNSLLYIAVKKLRKSVNICLSYRKNKSVSFFMAHSVLQFCWCRSTPSSANFAPKWSTATYTCWFECRIHLMANCGRMVSYR